MLITTFHRWFPPPLRLNLAMAAARCFAAWDAARCAAGGGAGREVLPGPEGIQMGQGKSTRLHDFPFWLVVSTPLKNISQWEGLSHILWKIKNVWNHQPAFNSGRCWEVRHRYIDMVKVCFLGNLYQHTSGLSNWLWKHCCSPAWHLCISVLSVLWVSVNSFFQLHIG